MITEAELATYLGFDGRQKAFRAWCKSMGITPLPGRKDVYDPKLVRQRLDAAQGLAPTVSANVDHPPLSLVEQRRARRGKV
jgi:hypothetical protein